MRKNDSLWLMGETKVWICQQQYSETKPWNEKKLNKWVIYVVKNV